MGWEVFVLGMQGEMIGVIVGVLLSLLVEYWPKYETLEPKVKRLVFGGLCLIVPTVGVILGVYTGLQVLVWDTTVWPALVAAAVAFGAGTVAHTRKLTAK